jgi:hypothetical protein
LSLPAVQLAGQRNQHHLRRGGVDHEPDLISWRTRTISADLWNSTAFSS